MRRVADIFAGTGTLGLEALSRGAKSVVFVEFDRKAHELLQENVAKLGVEAETLCWRADVMRCSYRPKGVPELLPFDVIFFDPPYRLVPFIQPGDSLYKSLERLAHEDVSSSEALLVFLTPEDSNSVFPQPWHIETTLEISRMNIHLASKRAANVPKIHLLEIPNDQCSVGLNLWIEMTDLLKRFGHVHASTSQATNLDSKLSGFGSTDFLLPARFPPASLSHSKSHTFINSLPQFSRVARELGSDPILPDTHYGAGVVLP